MPNKSNFNLIKILFLIFISISINANNLLDNYRLNGLDKIAKQMDFELTKEDYWNEYLKDKDTTFGFLEQYSSVLTCDKNISTLNLYKRDSTKTFKFKKTYNAFTGKIKGEKEIEGDLKTPIGVYNLVKKISKVDSFYGPLAFVTSYPNNYDRYKGRKGHGIWIHGLPLDQERDDFTKGCIAIDNASIECLDRNIDIEKTILIINKSKVEKNISKKTLSSILSQLYMWRFAWIYNETENYLSFYADDFTRYDGMDLNKFKQYKTTIFNRGQNKTIIFNDINIVPYPSYKDTYELTFKEFYRSNNYKFTGNKTLLLRINENNKMQIFTEQ